MEERTIHGFAALRARYFAELGGTLREYVHEKTGARLCWLDRPDENKAFSIAFKTLPEDSTGVFHIIEHAVLCGSDKYPVKEPFVELLKSSVQTYLNALTFSDKTVYPVSSRNDRDLLNLMDVYLDAVFHPAIYHRPEIFRQEGWRFEGEGEALRLQGVVLNEMKGAFSDPDRIQEKELGKLLFPDNCYGYVSGGDPACIPTLSYERFLASHQKYYHPSNAWISLVGSVNLDACLEKLDSYLRDYDRRELCFDIPMQRPLPARRRTLPYAIGPGEDPAQRTIVACSTLLATYDDDLRNGMADLLADYLTDDEEAPLKRAILDAGLAQDFSLDLDDGIQQTTLTWTAENTDPEKQPALERTVRETLARIAAEGLDRDRLDACFRRCAFDLRDRDSGRSPRSLQEALDMLDAWLYGGDPAQFLLVEDYLKELEAALSTDYPERLLRELFLDNAHTVTLTLVPSPTLGAENAAAEQARVRAMTAAWTEADWRVQAQEAEALRLWQQTPDSEESLATIPMLRLSDLAEAPVPLRMTETRLGDVPLLRHDCQSRLSYLRAHFEASDLSLEELPVLKLLCRLLDCMGTARYDRARLPLEIMRTVGRLAFAPTIVEGSDPTRCRVLLTASAVCLPELAEEAAALLAEMLASTRWDDPELLRDKLRQLSLNIQLDLASAGHRFAMTRAASNLTAHGAAREFIGGIEYARWLKTMSTASDETLRELLTRFQALTARVVTRERLILSVNETVSDAALTRFLEAVPVSGQPAPAPAAYPLAGARREGLAVSAAVGFTAMSDSLLRRGGAYRGSLAVLVNALSFHYLWNEIRVRGGAYGCGFGVKSSGDVLCYSYRDPQPARSLGVMRAAADWLRAFCAEDPELSGYILGAVSALDPLRNEGKSIAAAETRWFRGIREADVRRWYGELLRTTPADLLALAPVLEALAEENAFCVVAGKPLLEACPEIEAVLTV